MSAQDTNEPNSANTTNAVSAPVDDGRRQKRETLRNKFDQFLKESTKEDNNEKYIEALEKLKQEPDAKDFNLVCRTKGDQKTGLIILNRIGTQNTLPKITEKHEEKTEAMEATPVLLHNTPDAQIPVPTYNPPPAPKVEPQRVRARREPVTTPRQPKRINHNKVPASEGLILAMNQKMEAMWRQLEIIREKKERKKMKKMAEQTLRQLEKESRPQIKTAKELFYDRLEQAGNNANAKSQKAPQSIYKLIY